MHIEKYSLSFTAGPEHHHLPARTVLSRGLKLSRQLLTNLKRSGELLINQRPALLKDTVKNGDLLQVTLLEERTQDNISPEPLPLSVIYEDEHLLVVNKAAGMVVHPTKGYLSGTLANAVIHYWREAGHRHVFRPVHRLDRDTSGLVIVAKNPYAQESLTQQHLEGLWDKRYVALVWGRIPADRGQIDARIARVGNGSRARVVSPEGKTARTHWHVLERFTNATMVQASLVTGRTHQIRVHMSHIGYPIIGDDVYGEPTPLISRQALHAAEINFTHPVHHIPLSFQCDPPEDIKVLLSKLK